jgi:hypothetical protein
LRELEDQNRELGERLAVSNSKVVEQRELIDRLKQYKVCFKSAKSSQCKLCHRFYPISVFLSHIGLCQKESSTYN